MPNMYRWALTATQLFSRGGNLISASAVPSIRERVGREVVHAKHLLFSSFVLPVGAWRRYSSRATPWQARPPSQFDSMAYKRQFLSQASSTLLLTWTSGTPASRQSLVWAGYTSSPTYCHHGLVFRLVSKGRRGRRLGWVRGVGSGGQSDPKCFQLYTAKLWWVSRTSEGPEGVGEGRKEGGRVGLRETERERGGGCWNRKSESRPSVICLRDTTHIQLVLWTRRQDGRGGGVLCPTCLCNQADLIRSAFYLGNGTK